MRPLTIHKGRQSVVTPCFTCPPDNVNRTASVWLVLDGTGPSMLHRLVITIEHQHDSGDVNYTCLGRCCLTSRLAISLSGVLPSITEAYSDRVFPLGVCNPLCFSKTYIEHTLNEGRPRIISSQFYL